MEDSAWKAVDRGVDWEDSAGEDFLDLDADFLGV